MCNAQFVKDCSSRIKSGPVGLFGGNIPSWQLCKSKKCFLKASSMVICSRSEKLVIH